MSPEHYHVRVLPLADFEARFFAALGALASLLLHAALLLLFLASAADEPTPPPRVVVEIVRDPPVHDALGTRAQPESAPLPPAVPLPMPPEPPSSADVADEASPAPRAPASRQQSEGFRELLRRREADFQRDMALRRRRVAALERFLAEPGTATSTDPSASERAADEVHACGARGPGDVVAIRAHKPMARYADVVPVGLFPPRYLDRVLQVRREGGRSLGFLEMALPPNEVIIQLDQPAGAVFAVGRRDARCLVGFSWGAKVFPLRFRSLPARYVGPDDEVREVLMDVVLHKDGSFDVSVQDGDALPFTTGILYDQRAVARNLQQRATGARLVRDVLGALFGG